MPALDIMALAEILRAAAKAEIMPRFRRLGKGDIRIKTDAIDLVTEADEAAERMIKAELAKLVPEAQFIGEESVAADPGLLDTIKDADIAIIVDPIDGTFNYAAGTPLFGVMAALVVKGETVAGIIYDPIADDWVIAERGAGAFTRRPDGDVQRLKAASAVPLDQMAGMASTGFMEPVMRRAVLGNLAKVRMLASYRCAAHEYRIASAGHIHYLMFNKLMPWDHLAGALIMQEAGAHVARLDGSAYLPEHTSGGLLVAPDRDSWDMLSREVFTI